MLDGSILQKLSAAHHPSQSSQRPLSLGVYYKNTLVALCHALEDYTLACDSQPLIITAFQRGKWYLQEADRYREMANAAQQIVILASGDTGFGEHPTSQCDNVALVELTPEDPVAQEWHLMILAPTYSAMVLCQELSEADYGRDGLPQDDLQRKFYGFWTFEADLVKEVMHLAIDHIGSYDLPLQIRLRQQLNQIDSARSQVPPQLLEEVVSKVVTYLQEGQKNLGRVSSQNDFLDHNLLSNELQAFLRMAQIIDLMSPEHEKAPVEVAALAEMIGQLLDLPAWQLKRLHLTGLLHRLGPLQGAESILEPSKPDAQGAYPACPLSCALLPGAQALRTMPRLRAVAQIMTHQTEWWNGMGGPAGLAADDIPLESRILGLAAYFQGLIGSVEPPYGHDVTLKEKWLARLESALATCQQESGDRWDPKLVEVLTLLVSGLSQGMGLVVQAPKLTNGLWLLDALPTEDQPLPLQSIGATHGA
ncbi:MAG: metal-dependent phosphohydrolase [Thermosynechococcaceae cyanobacterium MS004]|nr:metal-dependent phosphohydrolase [Thermosynechococcaceae cyanobacterium MS004]